MKIAVFSDIHDNYRRWEEVSRAVKRQGIKIGICCGDIQTIETLEMIAQDFQKIYLALGNADYDIKMKTGLIPENVIWKDGVLDFGIDKLKLAAVHNIQEFIVEGAKKKPTVLFYGHTHTPWEQNINGVVAINPGEVCGRYGPPSFAIFDTKTKKAKLVILN